MVIGRRARRPVPSVLSSLLVLLLLLTPALSLTRESMAAQEVDEALLKEDVLAEMAAAGTYRLLRYDVRNNDRRLEVVGEIDLRRGGKLVALADGEVTTTGAPGATEGEPANDGALRFYAAGGEGWVFDRMEKSGGELVYVFRQAPPVAGGERTARTSQLVIAATSLLPVSYLESGSGPAGPYAEQTIYIDFGDPVGTAAAGTPVAGATPVAEGCGNAASAPIEIAEAFVAAATTRDLERAALCFAPGRQPATWGDAFLGGEGEISDDVSGCRGVPYTVYESKIRPDFSAVVFLFNQACAVAVLDPWQRDLYDVETLPVTTLLVQVHRHDQRWYVQDALALVPD